MHQVFVNLFNFLLSVYPIYILLIYKRLVHVIIPEDTGGTEEVRKGFSVCFATGHNLRLAWTAGSPLLKSLHATVNY
jgi:hypothetical protein